MDKIKFKLVDGEPVCDSGCPRFDVENNFNSPKECGLVCGEGDPCIPGLRQQRDEVRADLAEARAVVERVRDMLMPRCLIPAYRNQRVEEFAISLWNRIEGREK